jgi:tRNA U34 5-methylaminomethyl-2-thiouridine-forming methyltransferase MnmC
MDSLKIIATADGSHSVLHETLHETYHSVHGAVQESRHVFITHGLQHAVSSIAERPLKIFEVGFGTGLNALLTLHEGRQRNVALVYDSIEAFPLPEAVWKKLNYGENLSLQNDYEHLHRCAWNKAIALSPQFTLQKRHTTLQQFNMPGNHYHLIYFDAFAPGKQPELWELNMLQKVTEGLVRGGVLVTYCAKGQVKRDLRVLGLEVETLPGPPGKKEMVRAAKRSQ